MSAPSSRALVVMQPKFTRVGGGDILMKSSGFVPEGHDGYACLDDFVFHSVLIGLKAERDPTA
jgi:hypothetical protein